MAAEFDVIIAGGGLVGVSMACALDRHDLKVAVIEMHAPDSVNHPSYDERTVALTYSSRQILSALGVWPEIERSDGATPILDIEVSDRGHAGVCVLSHTDVATEALGYVVPTRTIGAALNQQMFARPNIRRYCPAEVVSAQRHDDRVDVSITADGEALSLSAGLLIIADGGRSGLAATLGFQSEEKTYPQQALVTTVRADRPHRGRAYERFIGSGPLALLPVGVDRYAVVWTLESADADGILDLLDERLLLKLQAAVGERAGDFTSVGSRQLYPLAMTRVDQPRFRRVVAVGNAAHLVHPVAGQGFNLGLKDVGDLAELVLQAFDHGDDIGSARLIRRFVRLRTRETRNVLGFTDGMIEAFSSDFLPLMLARNVGLFVIDQLPFIKRALLRRTMGIHGRQSGFTSGRPPARKLTGKTNAATEYDVIIAGAGLIGSAMACALGATNYRVAVLDKSPPPPMPSTKFDLRINAYNRSAEKILHDCGVWDQLPADRRFPFRHVYVGHSGGAASVRFSASDVGETHLGYFIENNLVNRALIERAESFPNIDVATDAQIDDITCANESVWLRSAAGDEFSAKLLIASDGAESRIRSAAGISVRRHPYDQKCIVGTVRFDGEHGETAWQRFLPTGPLGLLPLAPGYCSLAWSCETEYADRLMSLDDDAFIEELDAATLGHLGRITGMGPRGAFPLVARDASTYIGRRIALIGDAAHVIHPLAGLGANIGFQDVGLLTQLLVDAESGAANDIGAGAMLRAYERGRHRENRLVMSAMTAFNTIFSREDFVSSKLRDRGLLVADSIRPAKNFLLRRAMWMNMKSGGY
jgi:2-polyprenyl-6-methoxyphenol 4-hydroxylase